MSMGEVNENKKTVHSVMKHLALNYSMIRYVLEYSDVCVCVPGWLAVWATARRRKKRLQRVPATATYVHNTRAYRAL